MASMDSTLQEHPFTRFWTSCLLPTWSGGTHAWSPTDSMTRKYVRGPAFLLRRWEAHGDEPSQGPKARTCWMRVTGALRGLRTKPALPVPVIHLKMSAIMRHLLICGSFYLLITQEMHEYMLLQQIKVNKMKAHLHHTPSLSHLPF